MKNKTKRAVHSKLARRSLARKPSKPRGRKPLPAKLRRIPKTVYFLPATIRAGDARVRAALKRGENADFASLAAAEVDAAWAMDKEVAAE